MKGLGKAALLCLALAMAGCNNDDNPPPTDTGGGGDNNGGNDNGGGIHQSGPAMILGVEGTSLLQFKAASPETILNEEPLRGYVGEGTGSAPSVIGIDFRGNGVLYALMSDNRLYTVDVSTGQATLVGTLPTGAATLITFNWDPSRDRIRALGMNGTNFEFNPDATLFAQETSLTYAGGDPHAGQTPDVEGIAFGAATTSGGTASATAWGIDSTQQTLVTIGSAGETPSSPDQGQVFTAHALSSAVETSGVPAPFDIETVANPAGYLTIYDGTATHVFQVNLASGALSDLGFVGHDRHLRSIAVIPGTSGLGDQTGGGVGNPELCSIPIQGAGATATVGLPTANCLSCDVLNPNNVIDGNADNFARFQYSVAALLAGIDLTVTAPTVYPAGYIAGGVFAFPGVDLLEVTVAPDLTITTLLAGTEQESVTLGGDTIILDIAGNVVDTTKFFAGFTTTKPFDAVRVLPSDGIIGALTQLDMYSACAGADSEGAFP
ncbi:MAG TPA: DUF4394 domain-containing protein [Nevskiaceae bacterium]|nr:DUF4394 domain-containing protein [Nevskiaceae bacterium]